MTSKDLLDQYRDAWNWGFRCDKALQDNKKYIQDSMAARNNTTAQPAEKPKPKINLRLPHIF